MDLRGGQGVLRGLLLPPLVLKMCTCTFNVCSHLCNMRGEERTEGDGLTT